METKIYKLTPGALLFRKVCGIIITVWGAGMGCPAVMFGLLFLPSPFNPGEAVLQSWSLTLNFSGCGLLISGILVVVGLMVALSGRKDQVVLTSKTLNSTKGLIKRTLRLSEITALTGQWRVRRRRHRTWGYWVLLITDRLGHTIALDIPQEGHLAAFDTRSILQDLKPRLPASVIIDPQVETYLATGQMKAEG